MNYTLTVVSVALIAACFVYMISRKEKNIATFVLSGLLLLTMLGQIGLDEYMRVQMLRLDGLQEIKLTVLGIQILGGIKGILMFALAIQVWQNQSKLRKDQPEQAKEEQA